MRLLVLALDYDGTTADDAGMGLAVRGAIARARANGLLVLLVTGRILADLRRVAGDLTFVDGVVAENGAVVHLPASGYLSVLAPPVNPAYVAALLARGIPHAVGTCLVDAASDTAPALLEVIRTLEVPLVLAFNGGRVMTLPQGVSKATGLAAALGLLRRSLRNTLAIGDRENDHELLRVAEIGATVQWGSASLRAVADVVVPGQGPPDVADYLQDLVEVGQMPVSAQARRRLKLGSTIDGREFSLAIRGRNVLIAGDAKSGKSWVTGLLCEQLVLHGYSVCVIDPEGDYASLDGLPGVITLGGDDPPPTPKELLRALRYPDQSVVIDLCRCSHEEKVTYIRAVLPILNTLRRQTGLPHRIVLDEAHYFLRNGASAGLLDLEANGYTLVTYRASQLPADVLRAAEVIIVTHESDPEELEALRRVCEGCRPVSAADWSMLGRLATARAVALPVTEESGGELVQFTLGPRLTSHVRHRHKYVDVPVGQGRAFVFNDDGQRRRARTLREFVEAIDAVPDVAPYLDRGDLSRWVADVFGDRALAADLRKLEASHRSDPDPDLRGRVGAAVRARYDL